MRSSTKTLIAALNILADEIQSEDGVANAAIREAANRLREIANCGIAIVLLHDNGTLQQLPPKESVMIKRLREACGES